MARVAALAAGRPVRLLGSGARLLADRLPAAIVLDVETADPAVVARLAAAAEAPARPPGLIYLRAPDARLPA